MVQARGMAAEETRQTWWIRIYDVARDFMLRREKQYIELLLPGFVYEADLLFCRVRECGVVGGSMEC